MPWSSDNRPIIVPPSTESLGKRNHDLRNRSTGVYQQYLSNAVKFSPQESKVSIAAYVNGAEGVTVAIRDQGIGIPEDMLSRIFEPFEQADGPYTAQSEGTGLGLAISNDLMGVHGGTLEIDSVVDRGTVVRLSFPSVRTIDNT